MDRVRLDPVPERNAMKYEVIVGNIGTVHEGQSGSEAKRVFAEYKDQSKSGYGRASGESVTILEDGEPILEHFGEQDKLED